MKNKLFIGLLFALVVTACEKKNEDSNLATSKVNSTVITGTWRITYFWDTDHEETSNYTGYVFTFGNNGTVTAVKTGSNVTGTWGTRRDDSRTKLDLTFTTPASFVEISDDWHVIERTDTRIKLQDISGGNGGTDYLTFERN
jgi:hypothetical protein